MKVFIFERIEKLTYNWHPEGGLVIIAADIEAAKELIKSDKEIQPTNEEWRHVEIYELKENVTPKFWVMQDAGCC